MDKKEKSTLRLIDMEVGQSGRLIDLLLHGKILRRLCELGFVSNAEIKVIAIAFNKATMLVSLYNTEFAIDKNLCEKILIEKQI